MEQMLGSLSCHFPLPPGAAAAVVPLSKAWFPFITLTFPSALHAASGTIVLGQGQENPHPDPCPRKYITQALGSFSRNPEDGRNWRVKDIYKPGKHRAEVVAWHGFGFWNFNRNKSWPQDHTQTEGSDHLACAVWGSLCPSSQALPLQ